jgi:hypothetical protein
MNRVTRRALVVVGAVIAAALVWVVAVPVLDANVTIPEGPGSTVRTELEFPLVVITALVAALAGWALLSVLERFTTKARTVWTGIAIAVLVLSLPYAPGFTATERLVLGLMHLAVAVVLIPGLRAATNSPRRSADAEAARSFSPPGAAARDGIAGPSGASFVRRTSR